MDSLKEKVKKQTKKEVFELAKDGRFSEIEGQFWLTYDKQIKRIYTENLEVQPMFYDQGPGLNYFYAFNCLLHGPTGTGKTTRVKAIVYTINFWWEIYCNNNGIKFEKLTVYKKQQSKWWDDYLGQKIVVIEELEPNWVQMAASKLKIWFDSDPFPVETKGGNISSIRPWFIICTSNYDLADLCGFRQEGFNPKVVYEPLSRRINQIKVNDYNQLVDFPNLNMLSSYFDTISEYRRNVELNYQRQALESLKRHRQFGFSEDPEVEPNQPILLPSDEEQATTSGRPEEQYVYCEEVPGMQSQLEPPKRRRLENIR